MNCPQCATEMVKAKATNFGEEYDYCRGCKMELSELISLAAESYQKENKPLKLSGLEAWQPTAAQTTGFWGGGSNLMGAKVTVGYDTGDLIECTLVPNAHFTLGGVYAARDLDQVNMTVKVLGNEGVVYDIPSLFFTKYVPQPITATAQKSSYSSMYGSAGPCYATQQGQTHVWQKTPSTGISNCNCGQVIG